MCFDALDSLKIELPIAIFVPDFLWKCQSFFSLHNWWSPDLQLLIRM